MSHMRQFFRVFVALGAAPFLAALLAAQAGTGAIDLAARITPTAARPEPVRQFAFFVLTKSYADVVKEVEGQDVLPSRDQFIDSLKVSPELRAWLKAHGVLDLTSTDLDKALTTDDIMNVPEFFAAYQRSNSGGVTKGLPLPKYRDSDKEANPEKYQKQKEEFLAATRKFIETHPSTVQGIELELTAVNPKATWDAMQFAHRSKIVQLAPETAQVKYLAAKGETDLDGHVLFAGLRPGVYWVTTLGADATAGDRHLLWDVRVTVQAGQSTQLELSNLNGTDVPKSIAP